MGLFDKMKENMVRDTMQEKLKSLAKELNCSHEDFFVMIQPKNADFEVRLHVYKLVEGRPKPIRDMSISEILGSD